MSERTYNDNDSVENTVEKTRMKTPKTEFFPIFKGLFHLGFIVGG